ncbi:uncharacterized protein IL334_006029 [Kwoniella shivajii]|uniref:Uncharacterized protein n=1 Tax=Kwoniella shivajii TaxID=564305 RepID=A0ABZ1D5C8_9TREE|nr:hypothetical protein IL334_006029 [Kwoniella shivajii]
MVAAKRRGRPPKSSHPTSTAFASAAVSATKASPKSTTSPSTSKKAVTKKETLASIATSEQQTIELHQADSTRYVDTELPLTSPLSSPSSSSPTLSQLPPSSSPKVTTKEFSKSFSTSTVDIVSSQIPPITEKKKRGRPPKSIKAKLAQQPISDNPKLSELFDEEVLSIPKIKTQKPPIKRRRQSSTPMSDVLSIPGPSRSRSGSISFSFLEESEDIEEHTLDEFLALCDESGPSVKKVEGKVTIFKPSRLPDDLRIDDSIYVENKGRWWVAKLISFQPATNFEDQQKGKDLYTVQMIDGKVYERKRRQQILMKYDEGIATCALGRTEGQKTIFSSNADRRPPTPEPFPSSSQPIPPDEFGRLTRRKQLYNIRPHLQSIILDEYAPARWRSDKFFAGGKERSSLSSEAQYGDMDEDEVANVVIPELRRWALREEGRKDKRRQPGEPLRPRGSDLYNALSAHDMNDYIENVLLPESIIELCIRSISWSDIPETEIRNNQEDDLNTLLDGIIDIDESADGNSTPISIFKAENQTPKEEIQHEQKTDQCNDPALLLYNRARDHLLLLRKNDFGKDFEMRSTELSAARARMRKKLKFPDEGLDAQDLIVWKEQNGWEVSFITGRINKIKNLKE